MYSCANLTTVTETVCHSISKDDGKYAREDAIKRCWRKADILPASWIDDIANDVDGTCMPRGQDCLEIVDLPKGLTLKIFECGIGKATN